MMVTGGLTWWKDFICAACYNLLDQRDEVGGRGGWGEGQKDWREGGGCE